MMLRTTGVVLLSAVAAWSASQVSRAASGQPDPPPWQRPQHPSNRPPLGDLSAFRAIAVDTLRIVGSGDLGAAKKRIKDLEVAWDQAEPKIKSRAPDKWETVDTAIDRALKEVRAWRATQAASKEALQALVATIDAAK